MREHPTAAEGTQLIVANAFVNETGHLQLTSVQQSSSQKIGQ